MADQTHIRMTAAEFKQLPETNTFVELIDGEIIVSPSPKDIHQQVAANLAFILKRDASHGKMRFAPSDVYLDENNVVQPDIFWFLPTSEIRLVEGYLHGAPDLVIEILSPGTSSRDRKEKYELYEKHGVREYWLVDLVDQFVEVYRLENGKFARQDLYRPGETFTSSVLARDLVVKEIFEG